MLLLVNVDDISGEVIPHVIDELMERGAMSVHVVQAITKKGRLEFLWYIDAPEEHVEKLGGFLAGELGTLGVRVFDPHHIRFEYQVRQVQLTIQTAHGPIQMTVRVKEVLDDDGHIISAKAERDDLGAALAQLQRAGEQISLSALKGLVEQTALRQQHRVLNSIEADYQE